MIYQKNLLIMFGKSKAQTKTKEMTENCTKHNWQYRLFVIQNILLDNSFVKIGGSRSHN